MLLREGQKRGCGLFWANLWCCKLAGDGASPDTVVLMPVLTFATGKYLCIYEQSVRLPVVKVQR